ncbi:MAG: GAF domain-containing protein [Nostocaceae cyanobacterium]|nr:GAF domain-containing protein [Nostocaceae cyanobacterium]
MNHNILSDNLSTIEENFEELEQILASQSQSDQGVSIKNDDSPTEVLNNNVAANNILAVITAIKTDLEGAKDAVNPESLQKILHLEKWAKELQPRLSAKMAVAAEQQFKRQRQWLLTLVSRMHQSGHIDALFNIIVNEIRCYLQVERALIFRFESEDQGLVIDESLVSGYTPSRGAYLPAVAFGAQNREGYQQHQLLILNDINHKTPNYYQQQLLEKFQVQSSLSLPIRLNDQVWGLLVVQQCSKVSRQWQEWEISLLYQIVTELTLILQAAEFRSQIENQTNQEKKLAKAIDKIRSSMDVSTVGSIATQELRQILQCDRVVVYRFHPNWCGEFVAESVGQDWLPLIGLDGKTVCQDCHLQETQGGRYRYREICAVDDVYKLNQATCDLEILEKFQVKAYVVVPIFTVDKLWGLLVAHQNTGSRHWQQSEIQLMSRFAAQMGVAIHQAESLEKLRCQTNDIAKAAKREKAIAKVLEKIRLATDLDHIFDIATQEVRHLLNVERLTIYKFRPDYYGDFVCESESGGFPKLVGSGWEDTYLQEHQGGRFRNNEPFVADDIYTGGLTDCHVEMLEYFGVKSFAVVAIKHGQKLWGLLSAFQHTGPRHWEEGEIQVMMQLAAQLGVALQQADYLEQLQEQAIQIAKTAEREKAINKVLEKIRHTTNLDSIFKIATQEVRKLLRVERLTIYKFRPDYFGDFVCESESGGWPKLVGSGWEDTYLQEHQGGRFRNNEPYIADDIYEANLSPCHVEVLEQFGVKSYAIVSIFQGQKLWGLLTAFQHSDTRHWEEGEIQLMMQLAAQLGVALQQAEYIEELRIQSERLAKIAERERSSAKVIEKIRSASDIDSIFKIATQEVRKLLGVERLTIYKFRPDYFGDFVCESESGGFPKLVGSGWEDTYLQEHQGGRFRNNEPYIADDIYNGSISDCHVEMLEYFGVKSFAVVAITQGRELWGLLSAFQHSGPRHWEEGEIQLLSQIGTQLGIALQQVEYIEQLRVQSERLAKAVERKQIYSRLVYRLGSALIQENFSLDSLLLLTVQELRRQLQTDRVAVCRFNPDGTGNFIVEDVGSNWIKVVGTDLAKVEDIDIQKHKGSWYRRKQTFSVNDIQTVEHDEFHIPLLEQWGTQAYMIAPIFKADQPWGLILALQNDAPREWEEMDTNLLPQIGLQIGLALQQAEYLEQMRSATEMLTAAAQREKTAKEKLQQEVIQLLTAVRPALRGDLTVRAPITETEVGTVADAYNNTLQSLRQIIQQVQTASRQVAQTSQHSESSISNLATEALTQYQSLSLALEQIQTMVNSTLAVGTNAQQVEAAAQAANQIVRQGDEAMNHAVDGIMGIRETVAETSKRLTRLSESSQKVSKVVSLISNFTTQTQILALNAAIEATRAGEYGRGFGVVADEVRSLARQSANAATEIEQLVQEIQEGTAEVSIALEKGIQQVAEGTTIVHDARSNLNAIVTATTEISQLVDGITEATQLQTEQFQSVTETMKDVAKIANKTSEDSLAISTSFKELLAMAQNLQTNADKFKVD